MTNEFEITYIGNGPLRTEFEKRLKEYSGKTTIRYIPAVNNREIHRYYYCADYFVNFNPDEIFGMAILEAMYQGCTVVARHAPGPDYIIENGKSGYLTDSVAQMAEKILDGQLGGKEVMTRILDQFTWDTTAKEFINIMILM